MQFHCLKINPYHALEASIGETLERKEFMFPSVQLQMVYFNFVHMVPINRRELNLLQYHILCDLLGPACVAFHQLLCVIIGMHKAFGHYLLWRCHH